MYSLPVTRIIVTVNAEQYHVVEITGAGDGNTIRERMFAKLHIPDDRRSRFRVYQSQVGAYAISGALSDAMIFELCSTQGDASGSLTFFISTAPDRTYSEATPSSNGMTSEYSKKHLLATSPSRRQYARGS